MNWIIRLKEEQKVSKNAFFITLTYNDEHIPRDQFGNTHVSKPDVQKFLKRLRKKLPSQSNLRYYFASEYGPTTFRPHYHAVLFNLPFKTLRKNTELISSSWSINKKPMGFVQVEEVNENRIAYVAGYCMDKDKSMKSDYVVFSLMSKGIGKNYLDNKSRFNWHKDLPLENMYYPTENGGKLALPRYYRNKILNSDITREVLRGISEKTAFEDWCKNQDEIHAEFTKTVEKIHQQEKRYNKNKYKRKL